MEENGFTVLENKTIGRNISMYRRMRDIKASDMAEQLGLKEAAYTKYERGETQITIGFVQKSAEVFKIDPLSLLSTTPGSFIDSGNNSPGAIVGNNNFQVMSEEQTKMMFTLIQTVTSLNEKIMAMLDKK